MSLRQQALTLLSKREYSVAQLRHKLLLKGYSDPELSDLIVDLIQKSWLSDERFLECTVRARTRKGIGPLRLQQELQQKGIQKQLLEESQEWASTDWKQVAKAAYLKKYQEKSIDTPLEGQKRARFLVSRGFSPELAWNIVKDFLQVVQ